MGETEEEPLSQNLFQDLIKEWDTDHVQNNYDPTEILHKMADIIEKETNVYMASDPDPFEERHPSRVDPECQLGFLLKIYFKKESLVQEVFNHYMKENYFTRAGLDKSSFNLNVASCRLVLDILPGLEIGVLHETDGLITQMYKWVSGEQEPLCSYATGLLAVAMELNEVATDAEIRERNSKLVPQMLVKLRELQDQAEKERDQARSDRFKRPFALFSKSPLKNLRRLSEDGEVEGVGKLINGCDNSNGIGEKELEGEEGFGGGGKKETGGGFKRALDRSGSGSLVAPGWPNGIMSPPRGSTENSSSSWAEMELNVIGHFEIFPVSLQASQIFILRLLTPLAEYQDFLSLTQGSKILEVLERYINVRETRDARLAFEALKLLASLFCHKKFTLEWVATGGLSLLMRMPRPSMAATGSSLCLYYLACDDDTMEKICSLPPHTLQELVNYCLWLLECSHETGRQYSIMFFGLAFPFRSILEVFDSSDGLRKLYNTISTLSIISDKDDERDNLSDDQEFMQRQSVRYTTQSLKKYVEAHLAIKVEEEISRDLTISGCSPQPPHPSYKPYRLEQDQVTEHIFTLLELMNYRGRWEPIDRLIKLGGIQLLLQVIALSYDWTYNGRAETVKSALDVLAVCSVIPRVQLSLCDKFDLPDESAVGINIVLGTAEGEIVPDSPEVQRAALLVLCHLLCGPVVRPGCVKHAATPTPSKRGRVKSSDEVITKVWECVRANNGIMALLQLIQTKTPLTDADSIRALACRALVGLARSSTATQIMSKLPIFNNGVMNMLLREPVLQDKRAEHVKFQKHAHELIEKVSGPMSRKNYENNDITLDMLHRASVVANTRIRYNNKQLLQLMHEHLVLSGLNKTAETLKNESDFVPLVDSSGSSVPPVYPVRSMISFHPSHLNRRMISSPTPSRPISTPSRQITTLQRPNTSSRAPVTTPTRPLSTTTPIRSSTNNVPIRVNRPTRTPVPATTTTPAPRSAMKTMDDGDMSTSKAVEQVGDTKHEVSLGSIVSDFLSSQHALCRNPMTTCPEFDLLLPHKCPDQRSRRAAPLNFTSRYSKKSLFPPYGGPDGSKLDRKLIYSRFRPVKSFKAGGDDREENVFTSCAFSGDRQFLFAGTYMGDVKMYNLQSSEETTYQCHDSYVYHVQPSRDGKMLITSSSWRTPYSKLWKVGDFFDEKKQFKDEEYLEFSCLVQDKVVGTQSNGVATVYDLNTGQLSRTLKPTSSNAYSRNRATFDPTDDLILSDGVLWDYRAPREIHKFDKLNQTLSGTFHPNGLEIISNTEVWDIRTFHLLRTVPQLDQCQIVFNSGGEVFFGLNLEQELEDETKFETAFKTFDSSDYSLIATIETKKSVLGLCSSWDDTSLAVVEQGNGECVESAVRLYDVGRLRAEEEDQEDDGEEEDGGPDDDDDSDGSDDDILGLGDDDDWGFPIPLFSDGEDLSGSGSGTPSEDDLDDPDDEVDADEVEDLEDDDGGSLVGDGDEDSWEDIEVEEEVGGD